MYKRQAQVCAIESLKDQSFIKRSVKHNLDWAKKIKRIKNSNKGVLVKFPKKKQDPRVDLHALRRYVG